MKKKFKLLFQNSGFQTVIKLIVSGVLSVLLGQALAMLLNKEWVFFLVFGIVFLIFLAFMLIVERLEVNFNISKIIAKDLKEKKFKSVVRLAYPLSRPLWVAGKYDLRIKMGRQVLLALNSLTEDTIFIDDKKISVDELKAKVLIDDLGWTIFRTNPDSKECIENINRGIDIAKKEQSFSLAIKGHRHLIGIYDKLSDEEKIKENINAAQVLCESEIYKKKTTVKERESIFKGLEYALLRASIEGYKKNNLEDKEELDGFIKSIDILSKYYSTEEDWERYAKTFYVKADILMLYNEGTKYLEAESVLLQGLNVCDAQARTDGYIRIAMMLMKLQKRKIISQQDKEEKVSLIKEFKDYYNEAMKRAKETNNKEYVRELKEMMKNVGKREI